MRELPILMNGAMVRAVLEGRKTVTRRVMNPQPCLENGFWKWSGARWSRGITSVPAAWGHSLAAGCPSGKVGDRLYVRETSFRMPHPADVGLTPADFPRTWQAACDLAGQVLYRADMESRTAALIMSDGERWTPSIHMPKDRARIWLDVAAVRVERLQDISDDGAIAEGVRELPLQENEPGAWWCADPLGNPELRCRTPRAAFCRLWDGLAKHGTRWADNPWVWVVEFRRVEHAPARKTHVEAEGGNDG